MKSIFRKPLLFLLLPLIDITKMFTVSDGMRYNYIIEEIVFVDKGVWFYIPDLEYITPTAPDTESFVCFFDGALIINEDNYFILKPLRKNTNKEEIKILKSYLNNDTEISNITDSQLDSLYHFYEEEKEYFENRLKEYYEECLIEPDTQYDYNEENDLLYQLKALNRILKVRPKEGIIITKYGYQLVSLFKETPTVETLTTLINGFKIVGLDEELVKALIMQYELNESRKNDNENYSELFYMSAKSYPWFNK